jgi:hypothetical protein
MASFYTGDTPAANASELNQAIWSGTQDLIVAFEQRETEAELSSATKIDRLTSEAMKKEVARVVKFRPGIGAERRRLDQALVLDTARDYVGWARRHTQERNPAILARFGVEVAFDTIFRLKVSATLTTPAPTSWWRETGRLRWSPDLDGFALPIRPSDFAAVRAATDPFGATGVQKHERVLPFCGVRPTYAWAHDPLRAPLAAVRVAAAVIDRECRESGVRVMSLEQPDPAVLGVDLGYAAVAQALSLFLPEWHVYTATQFFGARQPTEMPALFAAAVVNVPGPAAVAFVRDVIARHASDPPRLMRRWDVDRYWKWAADDRGTHCAAAVEFALKRLAPDGVLVLLTDIASGQFHSAQKVLESAGGSRQIDVMPGVHREVSVGYDRKVWGLYGCPRPTERLVTAWRRKP